jgi:hypothetical protein
MDPADRDSGLSSAQAQAQKLSDLSSVKNWARHQFISVDYSNIQRPEDMISVVQNNPNVELAQSSLDLRVAHPIPVGDSPFLRVGAIKPCLGMHELIAPSLAGNSATLSVVAARNSRMLFNAQEAQLLHPDFDSYSAKRRRRILKSGDYADVRSSLRLIQAAALRVDVARGGRPEGSASSKHSATIEGPGYRPERTFDLLLTFTQRRALEVSRTLPTPPSLIVLRPVYPRTHVDQDAGKHPSGSPMAPSQPSHHLVASHSQPRLIADNEPAQERDALRLKASSISGTVNIVQISCVLLGITPIPSAVVHEGLTVDSQADKAAKSKIPRRLSLALADRKRKISDMLRALSND